jgi:hypothetical protein
MVGLLDYIIEQAKHIDPKAFNLSKSKGLLIRQSDLRGLPGVSCDIQQEGDHLWLQIERLELGPPPAILDELAPYIAHVIDPSAAEPVLKQSE